MKQLNKYIAIVAKVFEVGHFVFAFVWIILFVMTFAVPATVFDFLSGIDLVGMEVYGFGLELIDSNGIVDLTLVKIFSIAALLMFVIYAMIFRNVYLIFRTVEGKTKFAKGATPFQKDVVRMIREIGIFYIAIPVVGLIMSTIAFLILGGDAVDTGMVLTGLITGILLLCLAQIFAYGVELQKDTDGLL